MHLLQPKPGWSEMDPDVLWNSILQLIKRALKSKCKNVVIRPLEMVPIPFKRRCQFEIERHQKLWY